MRFYRVHFRFDGGSSDGYQFFTSKRESERSRSEAIRNAGCVEDEPDEVEEIEVTPTKAGILEALNRLASHADNG